MTRKRFQKLLMSEGISAKQAKAYKIPSRHNGIICYCYNTDAGKTWAMFNGASYQSWWNNKIIFNNQLYNRSSKGVIKKPYCNDLYKIPDRVDEHGLVYKNPFLNM